MAKGMIQQAQVAEFHREGYVLVRGQLDAEEIALLGRAAREDKVLDDHSFGRADGEGGTVRLSLWNHPTDTIYGMIARCESIVGSMEKLLGGEVYHYHSKMIMKDARIGGAWTWHQDYGYWYQNGILFPMMASAFIAVDRATRENGCLQVVPGSHEMGRVDHILSGEQAGAVMEHVDALIAQRGVVHVEMEPGDCIFFHCNTLHRSDQNRSPNRRWTLLICYNAVWNDAYKREDDRYFVPLDIVPDEAIKQAGLRFADGSDQEHFASRPFVPDVTRLKKAS